MWQSIWESIFGPSSNVDDAESKLNIIIDGSWLFKACGRGGALSNKLFTTGSHFSLDFSKLTNSILKHIQVYDPKCIKTNKLIFATSILTPPDDIASWVGQDGITDEDIQKNKASTASRNRFASSAVDAGYSDEGIFRPRLRTWMMDRLKSNTFQEKQVDALVIAMLVKMAISRPMDYHVVITGDSDILPALKIAYPEYSKNVLIGTIHPDQLKQESRQTSYMLAKFKSKMKPYFLDLHASEILQGEYIYTCSSCGKIFAASTAKQESNLPYCRICISNRT